jgi:hypothetical protein
MAVTYLDNAEATDQLVTARLVGKPSGVASGDYGVFFLHRWQEGNGFPAVTAPSGAVLRGTIVNGTIETKVYLKKIASEINWNFSWSGARWSSLSVLFFRGPDPALDLSTVPFNTQTGTGTSVSTTSVTTVADAGLAWSCNTHAYPAGTTSHVQPTGYTEIHEFSAYDTAYKISTGSSESAASSTISQSQEWIAALVALAPTTTAGPKDLDGKGTAASAVTAAAIVDRPIAGNGSTAADGTGGLAAARPASGQATAAAAVTASASSTRVISGTVAASAAVTSGDATFERGVSSDGRAGANASATLGVSRPLAGGGNAAAGSTGSLVGGLKDLAADATAGSAVTGLPSFARGLDSSGNAAADAAGLVGVALGLGSSAGAASDSTGDLSLVQSWYRLIVPQVKEYFTIPGTWGLRTSKVRELTVFGDENGLFTSELGAIPEGGDDYGAIPFGTKYIWYGGHVNMTDDPAIRDLWLAHGFEVENVQV